AFAPFVLGQEKVRAFLEIADVLENILALQQEIEINVLLATKLLALRNGVVEELEQHTLFLDRWFVLPFLALGVVLQRLSHVSEDVVVVDDFSVGLLDTIDFP